MRSKTVEMIDKVKDLLTGSTDHLKAKQIAKKCNLCPGSIHRIIRIMRESGIGVIPTHTGYILSEFADKKDDVGFIRRLNGRRTSDFFSLKAAAPDIRKRWNTIADKKMLEIAFKPLMSDKGLLDQSLNVLKKTSVGV